MFIMAFMNAKKHVTTIWCHEKDDINFMCQVEVELGSHEVSNVDLDATWEIWLQKYWLIKVYDLLVVNH
jgi:hypothetical protein